MFNLSLTIVLLTSSDRSYSNQGAGSSRVDLTILRIECRLSSICKKAGSFIYRWHTTQWSKCSRTCGKGFQARQIVCRRKIAGDKYEVLSEGQCNSAKPTEPTKLDCNTFSCPAEWRPSAWSEVGGAEYTNSDTSVLHTVLSGKYTVRKTHTKLHLGPE